MRNSTKFLSILCVVLAVFLALGLNLLWQKRNLSTENETDVDKQIAREESTELIDSIRSYLTERSISFEDVGISIRSLDGYESYSMNGDTEFIAASVYKLPLAVIWYDKVNAGEVSLTDTLYYAPSYYEQGPGVPEMYSPGANIPLETLLETMIVLSDNTAGHILFEHLGGWTSFKEIASQYTNRQMDPLFFSYENVLTANYTADLIQYIYANSNDFEQLILDMKKSVPDNYLNLKTPNCAAQKYGSYDWAENAAGFVEDVRIPYSIVVLTNLGTPGIEVIGDINQICFEYFNKEV